MDKNFFKKCVCGVCAVCILKAELAHVHHTPAIINIMPEHTHPREPQPLTTTYVLTDVSSTTTIRTGIEAVNGGVDVVIKPPNS